MKRAPKLTIFIVMVVSAVILGVAVNSYAYSQVSAARLRLSNVKAEVEAMAKVPIRLKDSEQHLKDAQAGLQHLEQGVSGESYLPTMMRQLEDLGNSCGVEVTAVRPVPTPAAPPSAKGKQEDPKPYNTLDIEVKGLARYSQALRFVAALDSFPKVVEARTVSLEPVARTDSKDASSTPKLTVSILLRAYLFKTDGRTALNKPGAKDAG